MKEFDLPFLDRDTPLREAFGPMIIEKKSGIVVVGSSHAPILVTFDAAKKAFDTGVGTLGEVESESALSLLGHQPTLALNVLHQHGARFGVLWQVGRTARVLSISEPLADFYLTPPPGGACLNDPPDFYPPNQRDKNSPHVCVVCGSYLP
jgi:hypothetical protein